MRENPLNTAAGQKEILELSRRHALRPATDRRLFYASAVLKTEGETRNRWPTISIWCSPPAPLGIEFVVMPLVDNGRIEHGAGQTLLRVLLDRAASLSKQGVKIVFESDLRLAWRSSSTNSRAKLRHQLRQRQQRRLGYDSAEEISLCPAHSQCM